MANKLTPKDYAKDLFYSYADILPDAVEVSLQTVKDSCVLSVKIVLSCINQDKEDFAGALCDEQDAANFWHEVIKEIEKI